MSHAANNGFDFTPIATHYVFLGTTLLAIIGWWTAFISQCIATANYGNGAVNVLWFAIFLQLFLILGVVYTLATDSIATHRFQLSVFGAIAIVFAVNGANSVFSWAASGQAMGAGWMILAIVDIIWVLYFTAEEDSLMLHSFNAFGTGGLTGPSRKNKRGSVHNLGGPGYSAPYGSGGVGPISYENKPNGSFHGDGIDPANRSIGRTGSIKSGPTSNPNGSLRNESAGSPLMPGNAGIGAGGGFAGSTSEPTETGTTPSEGFAYRAKALYGYTASADDPNEISFTKGEILDIVDKQGKWWQAKKADGTVGIAPSNYLQIV